MKYYQKIIMNLVIVVLLVGCSQRENIEIPQGFLSKPGTVLMTQLGGLETPGYYKKGPQGLLDVAINESMGDDICARVKQIDATEIVNNNYYGRFGSAFEGKAFKVLKVKNAFTQKDFVTPENKDMQQAAYDMRFIKERYKANYALLLQPHEFGLTRSYYGFIPLGSPSGHASLSFYLVNLSDNSIVGQYKATLQEPSCDDWDTPPDYKGLIEASKNALVKSFNEAYTFFFKAQSQPPVSASAASSGTG